MIFQDDLAHDPLYRLWQTANFRITCVVIVPGLFAGLGLWRLRPWAHRLTVGLLWLQILSSVAAFVVAFQVFWVNISPEAAKASMDAMSQRFVLMIIAHTTPLVTIVICFFLLVWLRRPNILEAFTLSGQRGAGHT